MHSAVRLLHILLALKHGPSCAVRLRVLVLVLASMATQRTPAASLELKACRVPGVEQELRCGTVEVFENRRTQAGRKLPLKVVIIPAQHPHPERGPVFYLAGGPGETATELVQFSIGYGDHEEQDVVFVDQRGTGEGHRLDCDPPGGRGDLERSLDGPFDADIARVCREKLGRTFDLTQYSTAAWVEDLEEVRRALGYDKINLSAGSFGTYASLLYMRRYGQHVRSAYLNGLVPLANRVPLYHAEAAQGALDALFGECEKEAACAKAYPRLRQTFAKLQQQVREAPVATTVRHPVSGAETKIQLSERAFVDAIRVMMYRTERARELPFLLQQAERGDFRPFAEAALQANRAIYSGVRLGLLYSVTCSEFVARIKPEEIDEATRGSFLGAWRVRAQMAACDNWMKTELPEDFFEAFESEVPTLLVSGELDPASAPKWGEVVKSFMPNAVHVIVPGAAHTPKNACIKSLRHELFRTGSAAGLNLQCVQETPRPGFKLP